jgi:N-acetylneuraminic acid mutarotase
MRATASALIVLVGCAPAGIPEPDAGADLDAGSGPSRLCELQEPWALLPAMPEAQGVYTVARLADDAVVFLGGESRPDRPFANEGALFRAGDDTWEPVPLEGVGSEYGQAAILAVTETDVVVTGGGLNYLTDEFVRRFSVETGGWTNLADMVRGRRGHGMTQLEDGALFVFGGIHKDSPNTEVVERSTEVRRDGVWTLGPEMPAGRTSPEHGWLPDGRLLVFGGLSTDGGVNSSSYLFDPSTEAWSVGPLMLGGDGFLGASVTLDDGRVLYCGGTTNALEASRRCQVFDGALEQWAEVASLASGRIGLSLTVLPDGRVLAAGGQGATGIGLSATQIYDPAADTWATGPVTIASHSFAKAVLLSDDRVLFAGGCLRPFQGGGATACNARAEVLALQCADAP